MQRSHTSRSQASCGGGEQLALAHAAQREVPFAHALVAQPERDQLQSAAPSPGWCALGHGRRRSVWATATADPPRTPTLRPRACHRRSVAPRSTPAMHAIGRAARRRRCPPRPWRPAPWPSSRPRCARPVRPRSSNRWRAAPVASDRRCGRRAAHCVRPRRASRRSTGRRAACRSTWRRRACSTGARRSTDASRLACRSPPRPRPRARVAARRANARPSVRRRHRGRWWPCARSPAARVRLVVPTMTTSRHDDAGSAPGCRATRPTSMAACLSISARDRSRHARAIGLDAQAQLHPAVCGTEHPGVDQLAGHQRAAVVSVALCEPQSARRFVDALAGDVLGQRASSSSPRGRRSCESAGSRARTPAQSRRRPSSSSQSLRSRSST